MVTPCSLCVAPVKPCTYQCDEKEKAVADIVCICGSLRKGSYNRMLMRALPGLAPAGMALSDAPSIAAIPLYDGDVHASNGLPAAATALADAIHAADGVIICTPEYNF